jgi:pre-mRNA-splicing factor SYF2
VVAQPGEDNPEQPKAEGDSNQDRLTRFKALQARAVSYPLKTSQAAITHTSLQKKGAERNLKEAAAESQRLATDPNLLSSISRKHAVASHKLLKADTEAAGEDFERKRAWDWTIEESEKWDKRM